MERGDTAMNSAELLGDGSENAESSKNEYGKKRRIIYTKDFLVKCFRHPLSIKKPHDFPLLNLDCTLPHPRIIGKNPLAAVAPKRKDEIVKKETEIDDNISLRPQRATFSSGCAPNLSPNPNKYSLNMDPHNRSFTERDSNVPRATSSSRFNFNNQRPWNDNVVKSRDAADTLERLDRERQDRDRERDREKYERDRFRSTEKSRQEQSRVPPPRKEFTHSSWTSDPEPNDWGRRRSNDRNQNTHQSSSRSFGKNGPNYKTEEEPEWYSVPMSHNDTIELCGLPGDVREGRKTDRRNKVSNGSQHVDLSTEDSLNNEKPNMMDFGILGAASLDLADESISSKNMSSKSSRYTDLFASHQHEQEEFGETNWRKPTEEKKTEQRAEEMSFELRNYLSINSDVCRPELPSVADRFQQFSVSHDPAKVERSRTPQEPPKVSNSHMLQPEEPSTTAKSSVGSDEQIRFEKIIDQLVEKGTKKSVETNDKQFNAPSLTEAQPQTNTMCLPRSRPESANGRSTVEEMYADPLHPFTQLVRQIHNGLPMGVAEFVPRNPTPPRALQAGNSLIGRSRTQSEEDRLNSQRKLSQAAQEYHDSLQRQLKGQVEDMQGTQRAHHMDSPNEFEARNGHVHIPQPIYRGVIMSAGPNGPVPMHLGAHQIQTNGQPMPAYNRHPQYVPGPMNSYPEQPPSQQPEFTPAQVMSYLPYDIQCLISNASPGPELSRRPELVKCIAGIRNGEITLHDIIGQLSSHNLAQRQVMAMMLKFCFQGHLKLRGLSHANPYRTNIVPTMPGHPTMMPMPMIHNLHPQFAQVQHPPYARGPLPLPQRFFRGGFDSQPTQVPGMIPAISVTLPPPTSSVASMMAFTPTAVMRQMTAGPENRNLSSN